MLHSIFHFLNFFSIFRNILKTEFRSKIGVDTAENGINPATSRLRRPCGNHLQSINPDMTQVSQPIASKIADVWLKARAMVRNGEGRTGSQQRSHSPAHDQWCAALFMWVKVKKILHLFLKEKTFRRENIVETFVNILANFWEIRPTFAHLGNI